MRVQNFAISIAGMAPDHQDVQNPLASGGTHTATYLSPVTSMEIVDILKREIKVLAFDQYGTIVDMQKGLTEVVTPFLKRKGWDGEPDSFVTWWRRTHFENSMIDALCDRGHTPYRQIGHRAVSYVMDRCGIAYTQDEVRRS